uniref:glutathione transferase n=1 Tax=Setaria italica TaxID=4555 RepID=K3XQU3_SETIT
MAPMKVYGWVAMDGARAGVRGPMDHRRPEHLARNPFGEIPVLEDGELTLYHKRYAIARYVLRKHRPELLKEGDLEGSAMVDVWMEVEAHHMEPTLDQAVVDESLGKLRALLPVYEARLLACKYLAGDDVTAADLCHFGFMRYFMATEYAGVVDAYPHIKAWWDALLARPSVKKVIAGMPPDFGYASGNIP